MTTARNGSFAYASIGADLSTQTFKAKLLAREAGVPLNQALDRVAKDEGFQSWSLLVARNPAQSAVANNHARKSQITALPLAKQDRAEFVETANQVFEAVLNRIEAENPQGIRKLWSAEHYVDGLVTLSSVAAMRAAFGRLRLRSGGR